MKIKTLYGYVLWSISVSDCVATELYWTDKDTPSGTFDFNTYNLDEATIFSTPEEARAAALEHRWLWRSWAGVSEVTLVAKYKEGVLVKTKLKKNKQTLIDINLRGA